MVHREGASALAVAGLQLAVQSLWYDGRSVVCAKRVELAVAACLRGVASRRRTPESTALLAPRRVAMRLRVRLVGAAGGETHRIVTPEVCDLAALRALVATRLGLPPAAVRLSLNGTDELAPGAAGGATLQAAGIAPGDLLYVLPPAAHGAASAAAVPAAAAAAAAPALAPLTWQQPASGVARAVQPARVAQPAQPSAEARRAACLRALEARGAAGAAAPVADSAAASAAAGFSTAPPEAEEDAMDTAPAASDALAYSTSVPGAFSAAPGLLCAHA